MLHIQNETKQLTELVDFGSNPGCLGSYIYIPTGLEKDSPLVVVLHGCDQTAESYNRGSGWSELAEEYRFIVLFPEQQKSNNRTLAFNWFRMADLDQGDFEAKSIRQMIQKVSLENAVDLSKIYITGLSAGGAMTSAILAVYPDVFAGAAIIAGLPYGRANTLLGAYWLMQGWELPWEAYLDKPLKMPKNHPEGRPSISVWQGSHDRVVSPSNADAIVRQWQTAHDLCRSPTRTDEVSGFTRRVWCNGDGRELIEQFIIPDMGHGAPLDVASGQGGEAAGDYMLDIGISSTRQISQFWGICQGTTLAIPEITPDHDASRALECALQG
ncbi:PHB depolymerase family esterase [Aquabacter sp. CN5-332]|uniref:extracellular catalytic domain type 1 short-chain-length polyhydroxyalkanoate depolymerase n=1 Tax=Aquabacter sp. CN5-332 TaxID=3156608 RepID=UPI0032B5B347